MLLSLDVLDKKGLQFKNVINDYTSLQLTRVANEPGVLIAEYAKLPDVEPLDVIRVNLEGIELGHYIITEVKTQYTSGSFRYFVKAEHLNVILSWLPVTPGSLNMPVYSAIKNLVSNTFSNFNFSGLFEIEVPVQELKDESGADLIVSKELLAGSSLLDCLKEIRDFCVTNLYFISWDIKAIKEDYLLPFRRQNKEVKFRFRCGINDISDRVIFSVASGIASYEYSAVPISPSRVYVRGQTGDGQMLYGVAIDSEAEAQSIFGVIAEYTVAFDTGDQLLLNDLAMIELLKRQSKDILSATVDKTSPFVFNKDFSVGDIVTVVLLEASLKAQVKAFELRADATNFEQVVYLEPVGG